MKRIKVIILSLLLIGSASVMAQTKQFTLEDAIRTALANNYETKSKAMEVTKAKAAVDEAFGYALPTVGLSTSFNHFLETPKMPFPDFGTMLGATTFGILAEKGVKDGDGNPITNPFEGKPIPTKLQSFTQANSYEAKAEFSQILFNSAVFEGIGASGTYLETSRVALKSNIVNTVNNVIKAFNSVILTKNLLEITNASFENAQKNLSNVKALKEQGLVSEFDALQAEVQVENIRPLILQMENTLKQAKEGLKLTMGLAQSEDIDVLGELTYDNQAIPSSEEAIQTALRGNYDIQTLQYKQKVDDAFVNLARAEYWPQLVAYGNYSFNGSSNDLKFQNYRSSLVGVSLSINLFNGMQTERRVEQKLIEVEKTGEQINQLRHFVAMQIKTQINELERIKSNIEAQERNVRLAQRSYELATVRYKEGTGNQLEIQNSDLSLRQAKTNLLQSYYDYNNARNELKTLLGDVDEKYFLVYSKYLENNK